MLSGEEQSLHALADDFTDHLLYLNRSASTIEGYKWEVQRFIDRLTGKYKNLPRASEITAPMIYDSAYQLTKRGLAPTSVQRHVYALRSFFNYLCGVRKLVPSNPASEVDVPKAGRRMPTFIPPESLRELIDLPDRSKWTGLRDRAMLCVWCYLGLRNSEVVNLKLEHVGPRLEYLRVVKAKGDKDRTIPVNSTVREAIRQYLDVRPMTDSPSLFIASHRDRLSSTQVRKIVRAYGEKIGLKITPHRLRHSAGTWLHLAGADTIEIKEILGHASLNTTQIYVKTTGKTLQSAVDRMDSYLDREAI